MIKTKYSIKYTKQFKKDYKLLIKKGVNIKLLEEIIYNIASDIVLPLRHKDHILNGKYNGFHECHIKPDWLLIYYLNDDILVLTLTRTGSHSDLFD